MSDEIKEATGIMRQDFSHLPQQRMAQGKAIGEKFIIGELYKHGVKITPNLSPKADRNLKVDGYLNNNLREPVQIKLRKSGLDDRNDMAFEVCRNHRLGVPLRTQLFDPRQQGRDFKGSMVKHYFVMNAAETEIYYVPSQALRDAVNQAIEELDASPTQGALQGQFTSSMGVDMRQTRDNDPQSFTPFKVMAFVPIEAVATNTYKVGGAKPKIPPTPVGPPVKAAPKSHQNPSATTSVSPQ
jgi:hypothetical protein